MPRKRDRVKSLRPSPSAVEAKQADAAAEFILRLSEAPDVPLTEVAKQCGLPLATARALEKRLRTRYLPIKAAIEAKGRPKLIDKIEDIQHMLLDAVDEHVVAAAPLKDLAVAFSVLTEKGQLLKGEPTHILSFEDRKAMDELLPAMIKEAERRGHVIDGHARDVTGEPAARVMQTPPVDGVSRLDDPRVSKAHKFFQRIDRAARVPGDQTPDGTPMENAT